MRSYAEVVPSPTRGVVARSTIRLLTALCAAGLVWLGGCSGRSATVSGRVTVKGQPSGSGTVAFHPVAGGAVAYGTIGADGSYTVKTGQGVGLEAGEYVATVLITEAPKPGELQRDERGQLLEDAGRLLSPPRYATPTTSPLRHQVKPGSNRIDLDLTES
jgi:hypothetical protein